MNTVRELIEALQKVNPDAYVTLESYEFLHAWDGGIDRLSSEAIMLGAGNALRDDGTPMD